MWFMTSSIPTRSATYSAFQGPRRLGGGTLSEVTTLAREAHARRSEVNILIFDDRSGRTVEVDWTNPPVEVPRGPGRPKLGVVPREVTLLPRHWEWLNRQPGGASVALRKLVEEARRDGTGTDRRRSSQEATYEFTTAMAGDEPGYEEALRALYRRDRARFEELIKPWPADVATYTRLLSQDAFS